MKKPMPRKNSPPSAATLRAIPSVEFKAVNVRRNPYAARVASEGIHIQIGRGRPLKGKESGLRIPRSVRFPAGVWEKLERRAKAEGVPLHAALRSAVLA